MKIKPLFDRVLVEPSENKEQTKGGIYLPESAMEKPLTATVVEIGDGTSCDGKMCEMKVRVGDKVLYSKFAGIEYEINNKKYIVLRQGDILAKVEE